VEVSNLKCGLLEQRRRQKDNIIMGLREKASKDLYE
jgi:hypothetical protein